LNLFAFETIEEYNKNRAKYLELDGPKLAKLQLLTIADTASKKQCVPYSDLMKQLGINDIRQIEDKIIDCIYNDLLKGRLDQKNQQLHVQSTAGRDIKESEIDAMIAKLQAWDQQLEQAQEFMEKQANSCTNAVQTDFQD